MPKKPVRPKQRRVIGASEIPQGMYDYFTDNPIGEPWEFESEEEKEALWHENKTAILKKFVKESPGERPWTWWRLESPKYGERLKGETNAQFLRRHKLWLTDRDREAIESAAMFDDDRIQTLLGEDNR